MGEGWKRAIKAAKETRKKVPPKGSWIVRLKCEVIKEIVCEDCTEEEARTDPFDHCDSDELEVEQTNYDVISVEADN